MYKRPHAPTLVFTLAALVLTSGGITVSGGDCHEKKDDRKGARYTIEEADYRIPELTLINEDGQPVDLARMLQGPRPVAVNFIFTTCTTICPVMSATFATLGKELDDDSADLLMVSISIDPEFDTPARMKKYLQTFRAPDNWTFLTGTREQIERVLRAFNALTGSKMNHKPLTFFHVPEAGPWQRVEGLASVADLADEYRTLLEHGS